MTAKYFFNDSDIYIPTSCEYRFWKHYGYDSETFRVDDPFTIAEPVSALSGIIVCLIGVSTLGQHLAGRCVIPLEYYMTKASILVLGLGIMVFHSIDSPMLAYGHVPGNLWQGLGTTFVIINLLLLFHISKNGWVEWLLCIYTIYFVWLNNSLTYGFLWSMTNTLTLILLMYPGYMMPVIGMYTANYIWIKQSVGPMTVALVVAVFSWFLDQLQCDEQSPIALVTCSVWHISIAYVFHLLAVAGIKKQMQEQDCEIVGNWWPEIQLRNEKEYKTIDAFPFETPLRADIKEPDVAANMH